MQSEMNVNANTMELPMTTTNPIEKDAEFLLMAWVYPSGLICIVGEGFDNEDLDGKTLLTWHEFAGVEAGGKSMIFAEAGEPEMLVFKGGFAEHKAWFDSWNKVAAKNKRPRVFIEKGVEALVKLGPTKRPPVPEIDTEATERANKRIELGRERILKLADSGVKLTYEDCLAIGEAVDAELAGYPRDANDSDWHTIPRNDS